MRTRALLLAATCVWSMTVSTAARASTNSDMNAFWSGSLGSANVTGPTANPDSDTNPTTKVVARFGPRDWRKHGNEYVIKYTLRNVETDLYARVRGTSTDEAEPLADGLESPWDDLWFYSNPVFVQVR